MCLDTLSFNKPVANCASVLLFFLSVSPDQSINLNAYQSLHLSSLFSSSCKVTNIRKRRIKNLFECWLRVLLEANVIWVTLIRFALSLLFLISPEKFNSTFQPFVLQQRQQQLFHLPRSCSFPNWISFFEVWFWISVESL